MNLSFLLFNSFFRAAGRPAVETCGAEVLEEAIRTMKRGLEACWTIKNSLNQLASIKKSSWIASFRSLSHPRKERLAYLTLGRKGR